MWGHTQFARAGEQNAEPTMNSRTTILPVLRYRDAPAAIEWLCQTFGFEKHLVVPNTDGTIAHAQLSFGSGMIMVGSAPNDGIKADPGARQTDDASRAQMMSAYVVVTDPDATFANIKAAGAKIAMEIRDEDYGGRDFSCYDLEGHLWSFGSYDPWADT
jgi:uncharacterized glyoxalase superfamily protein PhnB